MTRPSPSPPEALAPLPPVEVRGLLAPLHRELLGLLEGLRPEDWARPTLAGDWRVRDVVAHLLDGQLRRLSMQRDGHRLPLPAEARRGERGLVDFLNALNAEWVKSAARLSPRALTDLLRPTGEACAAFLSSLEPDAPALLAVTWAGETESSNWMDVGREYTEYWHHQQQIRLAVGAPLLLDAKWLRPVLELSLRALPHRYREVPAAEGEALAVEIHGPSGGGYALVRSGGAWRILVGSPAAAAARLALDEDAAWRVFFKAWPKDSPPLLATEGKGSLTAPFLAAWAVMA